MISLVITAFVMGALGSFHCIGMCGPIALSLPVTGMEPSARFLSTLLYNLGRTCTYCVIGIAAGLAGKSLSLLGAGQALSIVMGCLVLLGLLLSKKHLPANNPLASSMHALRGWLGRLLGKKQYSSIFLVGVLNGLLPCGLVYLAMAGAVATASVMDAAIFMAAFGLGTLPLMWAVAFWGANMRMSFRLQIRKFYPYLVCIMASLLILRGLGLGIPFVSPAPHASSEALHQTVDCHD